MPTDDVALASKFCQLISNLLIRQQLVIGGPTFQSLVEWCLQALQNTHDVVRLDVLVALQSVLQNVPESHSTVGVPA